MILISILLFVAFVKSEDFAKDGNVIVLTNNDFDKFVSTYETVFIFFYAPWCPQSQRVKPYIYQVADALKEDNSLVKIAFVDATVETVIAGRYNLTRYPTVYLIKNGNLIEYKKAFHHSLIVKWIKYKTENFIVKLLDFESLESLFSETENSLVITTENYKSIFEKTLESIDDIIIVILDERLFKENFENCKADFYRKWDKVHLKFNEEATESSIEKFIRLHEMPLVNIYSKDTADKLFGNPLKFEHFIVFLNSDFDKYKKLLELSADRFKDISFVLIDVNDKVSESLIGYFNIELEDVPMMILSNTKTKVVFKPEFKEIDSNLIIAFIRDIKAGIIKPKLKSQPIPKEWDKQPVKVIVGKNFEEVAYDKTKHVFVEFYAPWCGHCQKLEPIWNKLAKKLEHVSDLIIAKLDKTANDLKGLEITSFPTIKLFLKETNEVINFEGQRTTKSFQKFLSKYMNINKNEKSEL